MEWYTPERKANKPDINMIDKDVIIAVDAMGGDHGLESSIEGSSIALKAYPHTRFMFFGDEELIKRKLSKFRNLEKRSSIVHTTSVIKGGEKPSTALRAGKNSSMRLALDAVKAGDALAAVSSGNTGALMAMAKLVLRPLPNIRRPAIASVFPTRKKPTIMLDLGANTLVDGETLAEFAVLGTAFARIYKGIKTPNVGLLNVGSEESKGPDHVKAAAQILTTSDFSGHYHGFVEGNDIVAGTVDVVVCDGYAGNIALKTAEGVGKLTSHFFKKTFTSDPLAFIGGLFCTLALGRLKKKLDPRYYNGGVFLGLNGLCVKSHGGSDALGFSTALKLAIQLAQDDYIQRVSNEIETLHFGEKPTDMDKKAK